MVVGEVGSPLLLKLTLLLLELLLLEVLDLGVDGGDGVGTRSRSGHQAWSRSTGRGHGAVLVVHHAGVWGHDGWVIRVAHDCIRLVALAVYHVLGLNRSILKTIKVELHPVPHARHVKEVAEVIVGAHLVVVAAPACGAHHGGWQVKNLYNPSLFVV